MHNLSPLSGVVSVEYRTTFEKFLFPAAFIALLGVILGGVNLYAAPEDLRGFGALLLLISFPLLMVLVALMFGLSSHYDFDGNTRTLWFRISIFSLSYRIRYASFSDISAFATSGIRNRARIHTWWTYKVVMLLKSGRMISISGARDKSVYAMNRLSEKLAGAVGCQFFNSEPELVAHAPVAGDRPIVEFHDWTTADYYAEFWPDIALSLLFFAAIVAFIVGLAVSLS